jgi:hypothetical protein
MGNVSHPAAGGARAEHLLVGWPTGACKTRAMPVEATFGRKCTYRAYGVAGSQLAEEELGSDEEALAWVRKLLSEKGVPVARLSRDLVAGIGVDVPIP